MSSWRRDAGLYHETATSMVCSELKLPICLLCRSCRGNREFPKDPPLCSAGNAFSQPTVFRRHLHDGRLEERLTIERECQRAGMLARCG